jgi:hypothetical protein
MQEIFMQEHVGNHGPGFLYQQVKVGRDGESQQERRIRIMTVQEKIKYLDNVDEDKYCKINIDQPREAGSGFERLFYFISNAHNTY